MSIILIAPGSPLLTAPGVPALLAPLSDSSGATDPSAIAGLSGWWDAGAISSMLDPSGAAITAFGASVGSLADKSGAGAPLTVYHAASSGTTAPIATPRLNSLLGGLGRNMVVPPTPARVRPATPGHGPGSGTDQCRDANRIRRGLDALSGLVAAQLAAEFDRRQPVADRRRHRRAGCRQHRRQQPPRAVSRRPADRADRFPDAPSHPCGDPAQQRRRRRRRVAGRDAGRHARAQPAGVVPQRAGAVPAQRRRQRRRGMLVPRSRHLATRARRRRYRQPAELRGALDPRSAQGRADPGDRPVELRQRPERWRLASAGPGRGVAPRRAGLWRGGLLRQPAGGHLHPRRGHLSRCRRSA